MGRVSKGMMGGFSGSIGPVVGASWRGIDYIRSKPAISKTGRIPTVAQLAHRKKFALIMRFLQGFTDLLAIGFGQYAVRKTGFNCALSYNLQNAIIGTAPQFSVSYPDVLLSRGDLPMAVHATATAISDKEIQFNWTDSSNAAGIRSTDKTMIMLYCPSVHQFTYTIGQSLRRNGGEIVTMNFVAGQEVETWMGFVSEDGKKVATSVYVGSVEMLP